MRFAASLLAVLLSAGSVVAQSTGPECDEDNGGPNAADKAAAIAAFESRYLPDGFYRPQAGETLCIKCGNAEIDAENSCSVQYEATRDEVLQAFNEIPADSNGCSNLIRVGDGADAGCLPVILATPGFYQPECEILC